MDEIQKQLTEILNKLLDDGWQLPIKMVTLASNDCVLVISYDNSKKQAGMEAQVLCEYMPHNSFTIPIILLYVDSSGRAVRATIDKSGYKIFN